MKEKIIESVLSILAIICLAELFIIFITGVLK